MSDPWPVSRVAGVCAAVLLLAVVGCSADGARTTAPEPAQRAGTTAAATTTSEPSTPRPDPSPSKPGTSVVTRPPTPQQQSRLDAQLMEAAWDNDVPLARRLIARGADVNAEDQTQQRAYLIATSEGYLELLELTLRHGADVHAKDSFNGTGLIRAADRGHWDIAGRLVQAGVEVDHVNNLGWTALHEAIILGDGSQRYLDTMRVLVAARADVSLPSERDGVAPLEHARSKGYDALAHLVGRAIRTDSGEGPGWSSVHRRLLNAATTGDGDAASLALRAGARLEARDQHGRTPLLLAVTHDRLAVARVLVALGADPDALDDRHDTPWLVTGVTGSVAMADLLLSAHPDLRVRNRFGGVSLIPASERGHVQYVRRVVGTGIDLDHVNDLGWTALLEAVILGDGSTPYQRIVQILLDAGADPSIGDRSGVTAAEHAATRGHHAIARILRRHAG